jgi:hypothetical protein
MLERRGLTLKRLVLTQPEAHRVFRGVTVIEPCQPVGRFDLWLRSIQGEIEVAFGALSYTLQSIHDVVEEQAKSLQARMAEADAELRGPHKNGRWASLAPEAAGMAAREPDARQ